MIVVLIVILILITYYCFFIGNLLPFPIHIFEEFANTISKYEIFQFILDVIAVIPTDIRTLPLNIDLNDSIVINIPKLGFIIGACELTVWSNQTMISFRGIPYAESPKGELRFKPPVPKMPWEGLRDARHFGRRCPVITTIMALTEEELQMDLEDCLNLCVYTKNLTGHRPVMVTFYGGAFMNGSAEDFPPGYLLEQDIVLVVPQYRIGPLGWLATRTVDMPGNVPLMDLQLALQWIHNHIHVFGGDNQMITLKGQSAGSIMIGAMILSPKSPPFKRAILQSGSILGTRPLNYEPVEQAQRICKNVNCHRCSTNSEIFKCLKSASVMDLLNASLKPICTQQNRPELFFLIRDDYHKLIPKEINEMLQDYNKDIQIMTGFTKHDGSFLLANHYTAVKDYLGNDNSITVAQFVNTIFEFLKHINNPTKNLLRHFLFDADLLSSKDHKKALPAYFDLMSIVLMKSPVIDFASELLMKKSDVYLYTFNYKGEHTNFGYGFDNSKYPFNGGIHHSDDDNYLYAIHKLNEEDTKMAKAMVQLWTSFVMTGKPCTADGFAANPMTTETGPYFIIDKKLFHGYYVLKELTAAIDDPQKGQLNRKNIQF